MSWSSIGILVALVLRIVIAVSSLYLGIQLKIRQDENKVSTTVFAMTILFGIAIINFIQVSFISSFTGSSAQLGSIISILDGIMGIFIAYFLLLIISFVEENRIDPMKIGVSSFLAGIVIITSLFTLIPDIPDIVTTSSLTFVIFFFYVGIVLYNSLRRMSRSMKHHNLQIVDNIRKYLIITLSGVTFVYFVSFLYFIFYPEFSNTLYNFFDTSVFILPPLLLLIGNIFLYNAFVIPDNPVLLQPQVQQKLIIMTREGTPLYDYDFDLNSNIDSVLVSGALTAITSVLKEATQVAEYLGSVQLGDQILKIESNKDLVGVLFTKKPTRIHEQVLEKLVEDLGDMKDLEKTSISEEQDNYITDLVEYYFGLKDENFN